MIMNWFYDTPIMRAVREIQEEEIVIKNIKQHNNMCETKRHIARLKRKRKIKAKRRLKAKN